MHSTRGPSAGARWPGQGKNTREGGRLAASADRFEGRPLSGHGHRASRPAKKRAAVGLVWG